MAKIKRCPFCGYPHPDLYANYSFKTGTWVTYVTCTVCGSRTKTRMIVAPESDGMEAVINACTDVIMAWDTRAEDKEE